ncbi:MAG: hypothetical protein AB7F89_03520 [Pirellulaceae bacterium]
MADMPYGPVTYPPAGAVTEGVVPVPPGYDAREAGVPWGIPGAVVALGVGNCVATEGFVGGVLATAAEDGRGLNQLNQPIVEPVPVLLHPAMGSADKQTHPTPNQAFRKKKTRMASLPFLNKQNERLPSLAPGGKIRFRRPSRKLTVVNLLYVGNIRMVREDRLNQSEKFSTILAEIRGARGW